MVKLAAAALALIVLAYGCNAAMHVPLNIRVTEPPPSYTLRHEAYRSARNPEDIQKVTDECRQIIAVNATPDRTALEARIRNALARGDFDHANDLFKSARHLNEEIANSADDICRPSKEDEAVWMSRQK